MPDEGKGDPPATASGGGRQVRPEVPGKQPILKAVPVQGIRKGCNRGGDLYKEEHARCKSLRDSPIFYMRRRLNGKDGKNYGKRNAEYRDTVGAGHAAAKQSTTMNPARKKKT